MPYAEKKQNAIDLSHHLSDLALSRSTSPLKGLARYFGRPGIITLAGGTHSGLGLSLWLGRGMESTVLTAMLNGRHPQPRLLSLCFHLW